ncbi:MAG TPA: CvpA family protein [Verrucomicrobiae bacterium]|nr:CvpA family protein [Verrucomicrobiae bacterium]
MGLGTFAVSFGGNWYDIVVIAALIYGVVAGVRNGFSGEIILVLGLLLMVALAMSFYASVGEWLQNVTRLTVELANLVAFVSIAVLVYIVTVAVRLAVHRKLKQRPFAALIENIGGGVAGLLRMIVVMTWLTVVLSLSPSPFWREQAAYKSRFGAFVVEQFPAVAAVAKKQLPEKVWFLKDLKRPKEPTIDESDTQTKP